MEHVNNLVTIVTNTKDRINLLPRAVQSILKQSYKNIEYIIIDSSIDDQTQDYIFSISDNRIKYYRKRPDSLISDCLLFSINIASGKYICFLDDDDEYLEDKVLFELIHFEQIKDDRYGAVYCWMDYYDDKTGKVIKKWRPVNKGDVFNQMLEKPSIGGIPTLLLKTKLLKEIGGWSQKIKHSSDWEMMTRFSKHYKIDVLPIPLVKVYVNHLYERQTVREYKKSNTIAVEFHNHFLKEFQEEMEINPYAKFRHLRILVKLMIMESKIEKARRYYYLAMKTNVGLKDKFLLLLKYHYWLKKSV